MAGAVQRERDELISIEKPHVAQADPDQGRSLHHRNFGELLLWRFERMIVVDTLIPTVELRTEQLTKFL